jgi:hypothetical protein
MRTGRDSNLIVRLTKDNGASGTNNSKASPLPTKEILQKNHASAL